MSGAPRMRGASHEKDQPYRRAVTAPSPRLACSIRKASMPRLASWQERKAKRMMIENLSRPADIENIARCCRLSKGYFISAFFASTGATPHQWLINSRVERAQLLLSATNLSIAEISLECGFYDQSHFSRTFVHRTGELPGRWRRTVRPCQQGSPGGEVKPPSIDTAR